MKGHIRERAPGRWAIVLDLRAPETDERKRKWHTFRGSRPAAENDGSRLITALNSGSYLPPSKLTVADFLGQWIDQTRTRVAPRTIERYEEIANKNIAPILGMQY
jgi:hypothetical protein